MIKRSLFYIFLFITALVLLFYAFAKKDETYAIVAELEPKKTAISFHKSVRIQNLHVNSGQHVRKGDLLVEVERPDLELDIEMARNSLKILDNQILKLQTDYENDKQSQSLKHRQNMSVLEARIQQLKTDFKTDSIFYNEVIDWMGADSLAEDQLYDIRLQSLIDEKDLEIRRYQSDQSGRNALFEKEFEELQLEQSRRNEELKALLQEKSELVQHSPFDGTVGNVSVQLNELIPPYQTIVSIYDESPDMIKGYMNEQVNIPVLVGEKVKVQSISRDYTIEGEVVEIGARIVSYPKQLRNTQQVQLWGKELFVQIPPENNFLNGEKVYVIIESK